MNRSYIIDRTDPRVEGCEALCRDCDWHIVGDHIEYGNVQKRVRNHVIRTDHHVVVRKQCVTIYRPKATA